MRKTLCIALIASCIVMASGCGTKGGTEEKAVEASVQETVEAVPDTPDEVQEPVSAEEEEQENENTETGDTDDTEDTASVYSDILDMFYYKILTGWDCTEDVSYMFYWDYSSVKSLSDAGYALTDLDGNGVPELLVSPVEDAREGMIYDLYAYADGKVVHTATGGERFCYYLCEDNSIYYWGSSGASNNTQVNYALDTNTGLLCPKEVVIYDENEDKGNSWFYGTEECYDKESGFQFEKMSHITEEEAQDICGNYKVGAIELTLFDEYSPRGDMPADLTLKKAFREAVGEERELFFTADDFDGDGRMEAFGAVGVDDGIDLNDVSLYYIDADENASCIDTFPKIYAYGGMEAGMHWDPVMEAGSTGFICLGGADGQETWLYGVRDGKAYQPEVSGQYADFRKTEDGEYIAQPHEGGEGYYIIYYDYDPATGEFVPIKSE